MFKLPIAKNTGGSCDTPKKPTGPELIANIASLGKTMGMDQKCVTYAENQNSSGGMSASVDVPFVAAQAEMHYQQASGKSGSSGCSNSIINASKNLTEINNINCNVNSSATNVTVSSNASATISLQVGISLGTNPDGSSKGTKLDAVTLASQQEMLTQLNSTREAVVVASLSGNFTALKEKLVTATLKGIDQNISELMDWGSVIILDSTLKNKITTDIKVVSTLSGTAQTKTNSALKNVVERTVEDTVKKTIGLTSDVPPSTKTMISSEVKNKTKNINNIIKSAVSNTKITPSSNGAILINAPLKIEMTNATIDNNIAITVATAAMVKQATTMGNTIASDILSKLATKSSTEQTSKGMVDLVKAQGDANAKALALGTGAGIGTMAYIIIGVIALFVLLGVVYAITNSGKSATLAKTMKNSGKSVNMAKTMKRP